MEQQEMLELLEQVQAGKTSPKEALLQMKMQPFEDLGYAKVDPQRPAGSGGGPLRGLQNGGADPGHRRRPRSQ